jgi:predicted NBD/HSP70 family sugar kinase
MSRKAPESARKPAASRTAKAGARRPISERAELSRRATEGSTRHEPAPLGERANVREVLGLVWRERQISRADISRITDLSRSTVSDIVSELLATRIVLEVGAGPSRGGRRPIVLEFQDDAFWILGVDMGASHVSVALTNLRGQVHAWEERNHPVRTDPPGTRALVLELAGRCIEKQRAAGVPLLGVGVSVPSPVDPNHPDRLSLAVLPAWGGRGVSDELERAFGVPVFVDNDANLGALAEQWWGASRHVRDSAYLKVATGVGSGHVIDGRIYRGASGTAGEIGHLSIDIHGPRCPCGLRGCLSTFVGTEALTQRTIELLREHPQSSLVGRRIDITSIEDAAIAGDEIARKVIAEAAEYLGIAVAGLLNLMNPAVVSIGGSLARVGDLLVLPLREAVKNRTLASSVAAAEVVASALGERDVAIGAATLVLQAMLDNPHRFPAAFTRGTAGKTAEARLA